MALDYWYDAQLKRYWLQFTRIFAGFSYETGIGSTGTKTLKTFPVSLASKDRQIQHIIRNGSENAVLSTPRVTCEMVSISMAPDRRQNPNHVSSVNVWERHIDPTTNKYNSELGKTYTVDRYMAIPYNMTMRVNVWTSNESQKQQFMEQVLVLFNPSIDIQTGDNPIDWTSLTYVEMLDEISWSNRDFPIGDDDIEVSTLSFLVPIWLSPPAKIKRQNIIHQIITNIGLVNEQEEYMEGQSGGYNFSSSDLHTRVVVTPGNHQARVEVEGGPTPSLTVTLLSPEGHVSTPQGGVYSWATLLEPYGRYRAGVSQFRLKTTNNLDHDDSDIVGIFDFHPTDVNKILFTPDYDTLPNNTMAAVGGIIAIGQPIENNEFHDNGSPRKVGRWPGDGVLPVAEAGQRYILADDLPSDPMWGGVQASMNDIIEFDGSSWSVVFDASVNTHIEFVQNNRSGKQLKWTGEVWVDAIAADYFPGYWRVFL